MDKTTQLEENKNSKLLDQKTGMFSGRLNRRGYLLGYGLIVIATIVLIGISPLIDRQNLHMEQGYAQLWGFYLLGLVFFSISISLRRVHDFGRFSILKYIAFFPFLNLFLLPLLAIIPGDNGKNKYGDINSGKGLPVATLFNNNQKLNEIKDFPTWIFGDDTLNMYTGQCYIYDNNLQQIANRFDILFNLAITNKGLMIFKRQYELGKQIDSTVSNEEIKERLLYKYISYEEISDVKAQSDIIAEIDLLNGEKVYISCVNEYPRFVYKYFAQRLMLPIISYFKQDANDGSAIRNFDTLYKSFLDSINPSFVQNSRPIIISKINLILENGENILNIAERPVKYRWVNYTIFTIFLILWLISLLGLFSDTGLSQDWGVYVAFTAICWIIMGAGIFSFTRKNSYLVFTNRRFFKIGEYGHVSKPVRYIDILVPDSIKFSYSLSRNQRNLNTGKSSYLYYIFAKSTGFLKKRTIAFVGYYDINLISRHLIEMCMKLKDI